jgi:hypothetical protein
VYVVVLANRCPDPEYHMGDPDWLPEEFKQPSGNTTMGDGIASLLLYRSDLRDLSLSTLVVAPGLATPVHNHLAWGLVGLYQGDQEEEEYKMHDHHAVAAFTPLKLRKRRLRNLGRGATATESMFQNRQDKIIQAESGALCGPRFMTRSIALRFRLFSLPYPWLFCSGPSVSSI